MYKNLQTQPHLQKKVTGREGRAVCRHDPMVTVLHVDDARPTNKDSLTGLAPRTKTHSATMNQLDH